MPNKCIGLENMCLVLALEDLMHDDRLFIQPQYVKFCVNKTLSNSLKTTKKCLSPPKMSVTIKNVCNCQKCLSPPKMSVTIKNVCHRQKMSVTTKNVWHHQKCLSQSKMSVTIKKICDHKKTYITLEISKSQDN